MRWESRLTLLCVIGAVVALVLSGCGGSSQLVYQNISERVSYNADASRIAFASFGGNGLLYIYSINSNAGGLTLLTPAETNPVEGIVNEGGKQPAWSPSGSDICIVGRRGGSQSLFCIDPTNGDDTRINKLTDDTAVGADAQPSWNAGSNQLVYVSTKGGGSSWAMYTLNVTRDGSNNVSAVGSPTLVNPAVAGDRQWPVFSPDGTKIAFQVGVGETGNSTYIVTYTIAGGAITTVVPQVTGQRNEAPAWSADGTKIYFHSDRNGGFNIWQANADGTGTPTALTNGNNSDGFPNTAWWAPLLSRIVFTRDREVWTMAADGTDLNQVTKRYY